MNDRMGQWLENWRIRTVLPHVNGRLLDLGCGMNHLARRYRNGLGADVRQWGDVDVVVKDSSRLPFEDGQFDTVTILAALNHIPNRQAVLSEVFRVVRPGGRLVATMIPPTISRLWHLLRKPWDVDQTERGMKSGEVYGLRPANVRQLLQDAGFVVRQQMRFMLGINCLTVAERPAAPVDPGVRAKCGLLSGGSAPCADGEAHQIVLQRRIDDESRPPVRDTRSQACDPHTASRADSGCPERTA